MRSISDIANDFASALQALKNGSAKRFQKVEVAPVSTGKQLFSQISGLSPLPAAVVCAGGGDVVDAFTRTLALAAIVVAPFGSTEAARSANVLALVDAVVDAFAPAADVNGDALHPSIEGVMYVLTGWEPLDMPELKCPAYAIEFEANQLDD